MERTGKNNLYLSACITYICDSEKFIYSPEMNQMFAAEFNDNSLWDILISHNVASKKTALKIKETITSIKSSGKPITCFREYNLKSADKQYRRYNVMFMCNAPCSEITIVFSCVNNTAYRISDDLTGLLNRKAFSKELDEAIKAKSEQELADYIVVYMDVVKFKIINDIFGSNKGDELLIHISGVISDTIRERDGLGCRVGSDRFLMFTRCKEHERKEFISEFLDRASDFDLCFEIVCNAGITAIPDKSTSSEALIDYAIMAQKSVKGNYTEQFCFYNEEIRNALISEQEICGMMRNALAEEQFIVYYQPQYNHTTGMLIGAEALVRWIHPELGLISPGRFIPIFEKNGFITKLDMYVFKKVCCFIKKCIDAGYHVVPVSINLTRYDIFCAGFIDELDIIRKKYNIPSEYIRIEITESAALGNSEFINDAVHKLHEHGFVVEMDDFGSGYSSLNILKDIDFDIIKLDMRFLHKDDGNKRGGTILSSIVRMVNWLGLPVIAEGVETVNQADFLESIGCEYIQGFLYSRPLPEDQYEKLLSGSTVGTTIPQMKFVDTMDSNSFWSNDTIETLIFSSFVGGAAIFEYSKDKIEIIRVNKKYLLEISMNLSEKELITSDPMNVFDEENKKIYTDMLERAIKSGSEEECETWRTFSSKCCGEEHICLHSTVQVIGKSKDSFLLFSTIRNVTAEKLLHENILTNERRFKMASEHANIYYWEYNILTKEMHPCFRCMRDLGFPPVMRNYPEPAIEAGVFPPDFADTYRDWHVQMANGAKEFEAVVPLTPNKVPFMVKYTTEFDSAGHPVKAYGSATLIT